jgi:hypothetical protein
VIVLDHFDRWIFKFQLILALILTRIGWWGCGFLIHCVRVQLTKSKKSINLSGSETSLLGESNHKGPLPILGSQGTPGT